MVTECADNFLSFKLDESRSIDRPLIDLRSGPGCHQYYSEPNGRISSFNFDRNAPDDSRYQMDLNYNMCVDPFGIPYCQVIFFGSSKEDLLLLSFQVMFEISMINQMQIATNPQAVNHQLCGSASCGGEGTDANTECVVNDGSTTLNSDYLYIKGALSLNTGTGGILLFLAFGVKIEKNLY